MIYIWFLIIQASAIQFLHVLYSQYTEEQLLESLVQSFNINYSQLVETIVIEITQETPIQNLLVNASIIIDSTSSLALSSKISKVSSELEFLHLVVGKPSESFQDWDYFTLLPEMRHYEALNSILRLFNWSQYVIIQSESFESTQLTNIFKEYQLDQNIKFFSFPNSQSQNVSDDLVGVQVKPSGLLNILILNEGEGARKLISSLITKKNYKENSGVLLSSKGLWGAEADGTIIVVEKDLESATSLANYKALSVLKILAYIDLTNDSNYAIKNQLKVALNSKNHPIPQFSIVNIQNNKRVIIGSIEETNVKFQISPVFPGNTLKYPDSKNAAVTISVASGKSNYNGIPYYSNIWVKTGALFAIGYANSISVIPNYIIKTHNTDCSAELYNHNFSYNCLAKEVGNFGSFYIPSIINDVCFGTINDFNLLDIQIPMIADGCPSPLLTSKESYPKFTRTTKTLAYHAGIIPSLMSIFGWKDIVAIYENSTFGLSLYNAFLTNAKAAGINILNDENKRMIKPFYSPADFNDYAYVVSHAIKTTGRIFAFFVFLENNEQFYLISQFYDMGLRKGDAVFIIYEQASYFNHISAFSQRTLAQK
ncbi:unnamed protein product [Blepharisma stoltei]|uniref:Receptor ligand binding region domain-containing protein n=1 Tax=Blepharisma stoltei TaxID=1481888 RepID=A0AAU9IPR2_9CILI|nr:unnamed protein product [Blepharisma stoltei]